MTDIIINNFQKGIAQSPFLGFEIMKGLNITDKPGVVFPNYALVKESSTTITDLIFETKWDNAGQLWGVSDAKLYKRTTGGTWSSVALPGGGSSGTHQGIAFWGNNATKTNGYLLLFAGGKVDLLDLADETTWVKGWTTMTGATTKMRSFVASDNVLYVALGTNYGLGLIAELTPGSFDGTVGTAVIEGSSTPSLVLPAGFYVAMISELGSTLLVCANKAGNNNSATIFPWDKSSTDFDIPIKFFEDGDYAGWQVIPWGLKAYVHVGKRGQWYVTNGTEAVKFSKIPTSVVDIDPDSFLIYPDAADIVNGLIYFAMSHDSTGYTNLGIYSLNPNTGAINYEHTISTGAVGAVTLKITSIKSLGNKEFIINWMDDTTYGADKVDTNRYTSDSAYLITPFLRVGTKHHLRTFSTFEVQLTQPLASGDSVKLYYRTAKNGSWRSINNNAVEDAADDTLSLISAVGDSSGIVVDRNLKSENIQLKCVINKLAEVFEIRFS